MADILAALPPSSSCVSRTTRCFNRHETYVKSTSFLRPTRTVAGICGSRVLIGVCSSKELSRFCKWRLSAIDTARVVENPQTARSTTIEIPVTCYQLLGVPDKAEKDEIVKSVLQLKHAEVEEGYTSEAVSSRQDLLMDIRDKLLFEPEYAGNVREKIPPKSSLRIPWAWLPAALCLLQEVGEEKLVLSIGQAVLQHPDAKPHIHDVLLSMAVAECAIAKSGFEKNRVSQGFEALARAQCLLRSKISLGKMALLSQIEESLEELAPACTLELLGMPHSPENAERRRGAIAALRELIRQGLDAENACRVQDWPCFLSQALVRLMATEIVDLLPWDDLALIRKNKKSLESHNQRVVIDFDSFYIALLAHLALGFSSKQIELINKAKVVCECLLASDGIDLKFEEAFCLYLLGQGPEADAVEKLRQLESNSTATSKKSVLRKEVKKDVSSTNAPLEQWLKEYVLSMFPDTRDCSPSLLNFFRSERKASVSKKNKGVLQTVATMNNRPLSTALTSERRDLDGSLSLANSSRHLGLAVKQLTDIQDSSIVEKSGSGSNVGTPSAQMERRLGHHSKVWEQWFLKMDVVGRVVLTAVIGCILFVTLRLLSRNIIGMSNGSRWRYGTNSMGSKSDVWLVDSSLSNKYGPACIDGNGIISRVKKLLAMVMKQFNSMDSNIHSTPLASGVSSSLITTYRRPMPMEDAESLVKQWQAIKAESLGPDHQVQSLSDILDGAMLAQWQALADAAKARSCYWRFVLLQLSVLRAEILSDGMGKEMAEIDALLEEAAELVDDSQLKNPNYYSSYKIQYILKKQEDGSWRFCKGDIRTPS